MDRPPDDFDGFPPEALAFFAGLEADNSKAYWQANRETWEAAVRGPMLALLGALDGEFGPFHVFRPHRDVRFAKDKSPYKTQHGAFGETPDGSTRYVHLSASGLLAAAGRYVMAGDQLARFREAVADDRHGAELERIVGRVEAAGLAVGPGGALPLKTAPRGHPKDHPRIGLLRGKGLVASREFGAPTWLRTPEAVGWVAEAWRVAEPLTRWLDAHVGKSEEPADLPGRRGR